MKKKDKSSVVNIERGLTKAEEQVMQAIWQHDKAYLKDEVDGG